MASETQTKNVSWEMPSWLKKSYDWFKGLTLITILVAAITSWYFGHEQAATVGVLAACLFVVLFFAWRLLGKMGKQADVAIGILSTNQYTNIDVKNAAADGLKNSKLWTMVLMVVVLGVTAGSLYLTNQSAAYHYFNTAVPTKIEFADFHYHKPVNDAQLIRENKFLQAIIGSLKDEGEGEGKKFRIALGTTKGFKHPTPSFRCFLEVADGKFGVTGYAFRRYHLGERTLYEAVKPDFSKQKSVSFDIPASECGDEFFLVVRITSEDGAEFPDNLASVSVLRPTTEKTQ